MTPEQFCYWLQGYMELADNEGMTERQVKTIADHLNSVFNKVTPDRKKEKRVLSEEKAPPSFKEVIESLKVNPFDQPGVYCAPNSGGNKRIC